jgi:hypothetical protein
LPATDQADFTIRLTALDLKAAEGLIDEAAHLLTRAENLVKSYDYNGAIEAAQHCIELSVKSQYRLVGLKPPRTHLERFPKKGLGEENPLEMVAERLDGIEDYLMVWLGKTSWIGRMWAWAHDTSLYGCLDLPSSKLFDQKDASVAIEYAHEALTNCRAITLSVKDGRTKIKQ